MNDTRPEHGENGPSMGEAVSVHDQRAVVTNLLPRHFVVELVEAEVILWLPYSEYGTARCEPRLGCGHGHPDMFCFLTPGHFGPHVYKARPLLSKGHTS